MKRLALLSLLFLGLTGLAAAQQIRNGEDLLRAMHDRYAKTWYHTLTFTQKSTTFNPDGTTKVETWYEALMGSAGMGCSRPVAARRSSDAPRKLLAPTIHLQPRLSGGRPDNRVGEGAARCRYSHCARNPEVGFSCGESAPATARQSVLPSQQDWTRVCCQ